MYCHPGTRSTGNSFDTRLLVSFYGRLFFIIVCTYSFVINYRVPVVGRVVALLALVTLAFAVAFGALISLGAVAALTFALFAAASFY